MASFKAVVAGCSGRAVRWRQNTFLGNQTFGRNGVCGPLSAKWIKDRKTGTSFKNDTATQGGREEVMQMKLNQHNRPATYVEEYLQVFGLYKHYKHTFRDEVSITQLMNIASAGVGYYFIGLSSMRPGAQGNAGRDSGHAFAVDMYSLKFFDPNVGQASFDRATDLRQCFTQWFRLAYLDLSGMAYIERYV